MSSSVPDIRVRLTADGVQDVIAAFRRVNQEAKAIQPGGVNDLTSAFSDLKALLPGISLALVVRDVVNLSAAARESAENIGKIAEKTGASVGTLSVLSLAAHDAETSQEDLSQGLIKLSKSMQDAANGAAKPQQAFKALGITQDDLKKQDPGQLFVTIAQKLDALPAGAQKAALAMQLFGRSGANLLVLLDSLGKDGYDNLLAKAQKLGLYLSSDQVESARAAQDALHDLQDVTLGLATQFNAGFMVKATEGIEAFAEAIEGGGVNSAKDLGTTFGNAFKAMLAGLLLVKDGFSVFFANVKENANYTVGYLAAVNKGQGEAFRKQNGQAHDAAIAANKAQFNSNYQQLQDAFTKPFTPNPRPDIGGAGASGDGTSDAQRKAAAAAAARAAAARSALLQSQADNEIAILKTKNTIEEAEDKRYYDAGLITLDQYYDNREKRIVDTAEAEEDALNKKLAAAQQLPTNTPENASKQAEAVGKIQTQITQLQLKENADLVTAEAERAIAQQQNAEKQLQVTKQLQTAEGDRQGAAETGLQIETNEYQKLLLAQGKNLDSVNAQVKAYKDAGQARIDFAKNQEDATQISSSYSAATALVDAQVGSGRITGYQGTAESLNFQQEMLDKLKAIGAQMTINSKISGDPAQKIAADEFNASLVIQQEKLRNVTTAAVELKNALATEGRAALTDFFTDVIDGSKSAADAFSDLGKAFEKIVANMVSQLLVFYALEAIVGFVAPDSGFAKSLSAKGPFGGFKSGGYTGDEPENVAVGVVHGQEYVFDAPTTKQNRPLFDAIASGQGNQYIAASLGATVTPQVAPRATSASAVEQANDSGSSPSVVVNITNTTGQPASQTRQKGSNGQDIIQVVIGEVAKSITSGGAVGQATQNTFGLTRQGAKR